MATMITAGSRTILPKVLAEVLPSAGQTVKVASIYVQAGATSTERRPDCLSRFAPLDSYAPVTSAGRVPLDLFRPASLSRAPALTDADDWFSSSLRDLYEYGYL